MKKEHIKHTFQSGSPAHFIHIQEMLIVFQEMLIVWDRRNMDSPTTPGKRRKGHMHFLKPSVDKIFLKGILSKELLSKTAHSSVYQVTQ